MSYIANVAAVQQVYQRRYVPATMLARVTARPMLKFEDKLFKFTREADVKLATQLAHPLETMKKRGYYSCKSSDTCPCTLQTWRDADGAENAEDIVGAAPSFHNIAQSVNKIKRGRNGKVPQDLLDLVVPLHLAYKETGRKFLHGQEHFTLSTGEEAFFLVFFSESNFRELCKSKKFWADGTFKMCPKEFAQYWAMH
eukprot:gene33216-40985_t